MRFSQCGHISCWTNEPVLAENGGAFALRSHRPASGKKYEENVPVRKEVHALLGKNTLGSRTTATSKVFTTVAVVNEK